MKLRVSLAALMVCGLLLGCGSPTVIDQGTTNKAFPKKNQSEIETELKKTPGAWEEYVKAQERDKLYQQQGGGGSTSGSQGTAPEGSAAPTTSAAPPGG